MAMLCQSLEEQRLSKGRLSSAPVQIPTFAEAYNEHISTESFAVLTSVSQSPSSSDEEFRSLPSSRSSRDPIAGNSTLQCDESGSIQNVGITVDHSAIADILSTTENTSERLQKRATAGRRCVSAVAALNTPNSPKSPDRFIPTRKSFDSPATPFRIGRSPRHMPPEERLLRRRDPSADPFMPSRPRRAVSVPRRRTQERRYSPRYVPHLVNDAAALQGNGPLGTSDVLRQISAGAVWNVGGSSAATGGPPVGISDAMGGLLGSGTTAPMYVAKFLEKTTPTEERERHEARLALALDIDQATRLIDICRLSPHLDSRPSPSSPNYERYCPITWKDNAWKRAEGVKRSRSVSKSSRQRAVPTLPFRVLDAPLLRDDFYCSTLAYSYTAGILAVGLSSHVYLWSEILGVQYPPFTTQPPTNYVTSLSFSSVRGGRSILAVGRQGGMVSLWSTFDSEVRFEISQPNAVSCVAFKQTPSIRLSERFSNTEVEVEDLVVGDDLGNVWYYSIEWPDNVSRDVHHWNGAMTLVAKISAHTQQICGLAWSPDGRFLATGGNDNACLLFELRDILFSSRNEASARSSTARSRNSSDQPQSALSRFAAHAHLSRLFDRHHRLSQFLPSWAPTQVSSLSPSVLSRTGSLISGRGRTILIPSNRQKHRLAHSAAVKAIAFAPWQPSLLATGGGSNDRSIHFYHTPSGARLATINVHAQVTSLIWSKTRREIVATFGYAQPEHPFRIAVFAWPSCEQVVAIPWNVNGSGESGGNSNSDCGRALWAISYPGGPNDSISSMLREGISEQESSSATATPATSTGAISRGPSTPSGLYPNELSPISPNSALSSPKEKEGGVWWSRTAEEGCIIVASSDESVKFHEVWSGTRKSIGGASGLLGGSEILEGLEGIEKEGNEVIR